MNLENVYKSSILLFLFLNWFDVVFTTYIVLHDGIEVMPVANYMIMHFGIVGLIMFKVLTCWAVVLFLHNIDMLRLFRPINILMGIICAFGLTSVLTIAYSL